VDLTKPEAKVEYALVHLDAARQHVQTPRFKAALALMGSAGQG